MPRQQVFVPDPDIEISKFGKLVSLEKRGGRGQLLSPRQVASCVQFVHLGLGPETPEGLPTMLETPYEEETAGLKVNLLGGPTGSGKTSLLYILAGGVETEPKGCSDTKCPTVYILEHAGQEYAFLDTAGLCDTHATANGNVGMQELLINAVAATVQMYELEIVSFLMCVDIAGRLPGNFCDVWPQMQVGLGGDMLAKYCHFVLTKANGEGKTDKAKLKKIKEKDFYLQLLHSPLSWPVCHAGRGNVEGLKEVLQPTRTSVEGIPGKLMNPNAESVATKARTVKGLKKQVADLLSKVKERKLSLPQLQAQIDLMESAIAETERMLNDLGWCDDHLRAYYQEKRSELSRLSRQLRDGGEEKEHLEETLQHLQASLTEGVEALEKLKKIGMWWNALANGVRSRL